MPDSHSGKWICSVQNVGPWAAESLTLDGTLEIFASVIFATDFASAIASGRGRPGAHGAHHRSGGQGRYGHGPGECVSLSRDKQSPTKYFIRMHA
eukprot:3401553-Prymnesium_polylepis.2